MRERKSYFVIFALAGALVFGFNFDANAQEIPSYEEMMASLNEVQGTYVNERFGVSVELPDGWSGPRTDFENKYAPEMDVFGFSVQDRGPNSPNTNPGEWATINLSIINRFPEVEEYDSEIKCDSDDEQITWNGKKINKIIMVCEGIEPYSGMEISSKTKSYHFSIAEKNIMFTYNVTPKEIYDKDVAKFDASFETLKIENLIDITYEPTVSASNMPVPPAQMEIKETESESPIPQWIKNNIEWWVAGQIDDQAFIQGLQFLIKEGIMIIPETEKSATSPESQEVPDWIKNNADWWAQGLITDDDFLKGITFLVENGIIAV